MHEANLQKRIKLLLELLSELKTTYLVLEEATTGIENASGSFYDETMHENRNEIHDEVEKHRKNMEKINAINNESTAGINSWYEFAKNRKEMEKLAFPIKFYLKKRSLYKSMKKANEELLSISIENRFIKEKLTILQRQLETAAIRQIKQGKGYYDYEKALLKKDSLVSELKYLIPTIPGLCPADVGNSGINALLGRVEAIIDRLQ